MSTLYSNDTYKAIAVRLAALSPPIILHEHIDHVNGIRPSAGPTTLEGVTFRPKNRDRLIELIRNSVNGTDKRFAEGASFDHRHWALRASFLATKGIGFREIYRFNLSERPLIDESDRRNRYRPRWDDSFDAQFGDKLSMPDITSLHWAVADDVCNVHIDQTGFVLESADGEGSLTIDSLRHAIVELGLLTMLKEKVKDNGAAIWLFDHLQPIVPSTANDLRWGLTFEPVRTKKYRLTFTGSCALHGDSGCSVTGTFTAKHDLGSAPVKKQPKRW